jgi:hypothetical protein
MRRKRTSRAYSPAALQYDRLIVACTEFNQVIAAKFRIFGGVFLALGIAAPAYAASEFQYSIPPGWKDVRAAIRPGPGDKNIDNIPQRVVNDAGDARFAAFAIEPASTTYQKAGAMFNAVEVPSAGRITAKAMNEYGPGLMAKFKEAGVEASLVEANVIKMNGVNVGAVTFDADDGKETRTLVQYIIPGRKTSAVLSYSSPRPDFSKYLPVFEASARATKGGVEPGWWNWRQTLAVGAVCGLLGGIFTWLRNRREGGSDDEPAMGNLATMASATVKPAATAQKKTSKYTWDCPGCGKPVPLRLDQCRCGTAKPA